MRSFVRDILIVDPAEPKRRGRPVTAARALAAILLDDAGIDADAIIRGVTAIAMPPWESLEDPLVELITDAFDPSGDPPREIDDDFDETLTRFTLLTNYRNDKDLRVGFANALRAAKPIVLLNRGGKHDDWPADIEIHQDRRFALAPALTNAVLSRIVSLVTGDRVSVNELADKVDIRDVLLTVRPGVSGKGAVSRLRLIIQKRRAEEERRNAAKALTEVAQKDDVEKIAGDAEPLDAAPSPAVPRLRDLHGYGAAKAWGLQLANDLAEYKRGNLKWSDVDRGVLLSGPPGCGKTYFVQALAVEADVLLIVSGYTEWESTIGNGNLIAKAIHKCFDDARKKAPCILFIDEVDVLGVRNSRAHNSGWFEAIINTILGELDGVAPKGATTSRDGVVVIAATNLPQNVDRALLRPGRLDRHIAIPDPTIEDVIGVIQHHLGEPADPDTLRRAAVACRGRSPAAIAQACRDARRTARRANRGVTPTDVVDAARAALPPRTAEQDRLVALHESGHALVGHLLGLTVRYVVLDDAEPHASSTAPRLPTRSVIESILTMHVAGRAADELYGGGGRAGAVADLESATQIARLTVAQWGLAGSLVHYADGDAAASSRVREAVSAMLDTALERARELLVDHRLELFALRDALLDRRYLDTKEIAEVVATANGDK